MRGTAKNLEKWKKKNSLEQKLFNELTDLSKHRCTKIEEWNWRAFSYGGLPFPHTVTHPLDLIVDKRSSSHDHNWPLSQRHRGRVQAALHFHNWFNPTGINF